MRPRRWWATLVVTGLLLAVVPGLALAHGAGGRYELAVPQWMFLVGGGATVLVSFVGVSLVSGNSDSEFTYRSWRLSETPLRVIQTPSLVGVVRGAAVALLVVSVVAGLVGPQSFDGNLLTNLVWVGWWIGYTFSVILIGNTWPVLNPWKTTYEWATRLLGRDPSLDWEYRWGHQPAAALFLGFAWLEVIAPISESPRWMAAVVIAYSVYLWAGMAVFGRDTWLHNADPFTLLYHYLGRFAPLSPGSEGEVRLYGVGLVEDRDTLYVPGALAFLVAVLYTVTFDGFLGTPEWAQLAGLVPELPVPYLASTLLMVAGFVLFVEVFVTITWLMKLLLGNLAPGDEEYLARRFALSLLPIAIAYQVSHFFTFLLLQGQYLVKSLADPFGLGWNPLGLAAFEPASEIPLLSIEIVWQTQVGTILTGHVIAVWVAHHIAMDLFEERTRAIKSQLPMMGVMVLYTIIGLLLLTRTVVPDPPLP